MIAARSCCSMDDVGQSDEVAGDHSEGESGVGAGDASRLAVPMAWVSVASTISACLPVLHQRMAEIAQAAGLAIGPPEQPRIITSTLQAE